MFTNQSVSNTRVLQDTPWGYTGDSKDTHGGILCDFGWPRRKSRHFTRRKYHNQPRSIPILPRFSFKIDDFAQNHAIFVARIPPGGIVDTPGGYGSGSKSPVSAGKHAASAASRPPPSTEQASACVPEPPATAPPRRSLGPQAAPNHIIPTRTEREAAEPSDPQNGTRISTYGLDSVHKTPGGNV